MVELPGSVDFGHVVLVQDYFALRTAVGIYYGRIDRTLSSAKRAAAATTTLCAAPTSSSASAGMIVDSGILPYDSVSLSSSANKADKNSSVVASVPVSLALTPHHFITLTENSEVRFINRVLQKVIQRERVEGSLSSTSPKSAVGIVDDGSVSELLVDIRRPDQVWLRQGPDSPMRINRTQALTRDLLHSACLRH